MAIPSAQTILAARHALAAADPALAVADAAVPPFDWRAQTMGFTGLVRMIISQQVSTASANAIWGRFEAGLGEVTPEAALALDDAALRAFGLSSQKARYVRAIAEAHLSGAVDFDHLPALSDNEAIAALTTIKGVGLWTAELYLLFGEGRLDAFPAGDLALQEGLRMAEGSQSRLNEKGLYARAEAWRPYRGVAAHLLWAYYSLIKRGQLATLQELMSGFEVRWLDLREPADHAARDRALLEGAGGWLDGASPALIADLGCGSGSTYRALNPVLGRPARWRLIDHDPVLLDEARRRAGLGAPVEIVQADLAHIAAVDLAGVALVTASALLDLASADWVRLLAQALGDAGAGLYAALSYDGAMSWRRTHPLDGAVTEAFNAHQRTDKGFGPALGPGAAAFAADCLKAQGFSVQTASSPWLLGPDEAALERELVRGIAQAASEMGGVTGVEAWLAFRQAHAGDSGCYIGHLDLLALPPRG